MIKGLLLLATGPHLAGRGARYRLTRALAFGRDLALALWVVGVLAFCTLLIAGAIA